MHEFEEGSVYCKHCGTSQKHLESDPTTPCTRRTDQGTSRPFRSAMDDLATIRGRMAELREEIEKSLAGGTAGDV
jgi:hypothetical protein